MQQAGESNSFVQYRRKRRARDDPMQRNFLCNCGKSYLSYPALYTHIKNKHQGQAPPPGELSGINKLNELRVTIRDDPQNQHQKNLGTSDQVLITIINTFRAYSNTRQLNYTIDEIFSKFPIEIGKRIHQSTKQFLIEKNPIQKILNNGIKAVNIDWIMGRFISLLLNKIDYKLLIEFIFIILMFRISLNNNYLQHQTSNQLIEYTKQSSGIKIIEHINQFILYYFDIYSKKYQLFLHQQNCFIGNQKRQFICLVKFMFLFGRWAFLDRYTNSKIKINNF